jgi:hypothetical protein
MYIAPRFARFRTVALVCWILATWFIIQGAMLTPQASPMLVVSIVMLACLLAAIGVAFWPLGKDRRAGVVLDSKGMLLNLSHYAAFIAWENVAHVGISTHRRHLLALGSRRQLGIALHDIQPYVQSYEERMPAATGMLACLLRWLALLLRPLRGPNDASLAARMARCKAATGYDVLIPEAFLGGEAEAVAMLIAQQIRSM